MKNENENIVIHNSIVSVRNSIYCSVYNSSWDSIQKDINESIQNLNYHLEVLNLSIEKDIENGK